MMLQNSSYKPEALSTMSHLATGRAAAGKVRDFGQKVLQVIIGPLLLPQSRFVQSELLAINNIQFINVSLKQFRNATKCLN